MIYERKSDFSRLDPVGDLTEFLNEVLLDKAMLFVRLVCQKSSLVFLSFRCYIFLQKQADLNLYSRENVTLFWLYHMF